MTLTREQVQSLRQMSGDARKEFHLNRMADSLESIVEILGSIHERMAERPNPLAE